MYPPHSGNDLLVTIAPDHTDAAWIGQADGVSKEADDVANNLARMCSRDGKKGFEIFWAYAALVLQTYADKRKKQKDKDDDKGPVEEVD
jgi:hypothetical protein